MPLTSARSCRERPWRTTTKDFLLMASISVTLSAAFHFYPNPGPPRRHRFPLCCPATNAPSIIDDEHDDDYSRSLSPRQERTQVLQEYTELYDEGPKWRRRILRAFQSVWRRLFPHHIPQPGTLILIKSGESTWKKKGIFTGWANEAKLTPQGEQECRHAARLLLAAGCFPDLVATSMLTRAMDSAWIITKEMDSIFLPVYKSWRLNERMYGSLQGIPKKTASLKFGHEVVQAWRRSFKARPPPLSKADPSHPIQDRRYANLDPDLLPRAESLQDCMKRQQPLWDYRIAPALRAGSTVLVIAHSNSLRGLAKIIDSIDDKAIEGIGFPPGIPVLYKFERDTTHNNHLLKPKRPDEGSLVQEHTSGVFLEKPGLLKEALQRQTEWQTSVPGTNGIKLAPAVKRMTTMEESLLLLKKEQKLEQWAASHHPHTYIPGLTPMEQLRPGIIPALHTPDTTIKLVSAASTDQTGNTGDDDIGEFEEPSHADSITSSASVVANVARDADLEDGPVVVLVRHGTTPHNELGLFTGWEDPPLSEAGVEDAKRAGKLLKSHGFEFDVVYTSWLSRAIETAWYILDELDMKWLPLVKSWRLNERHYGKLTGQSKKMVGNIYGQDQLKKWRRSYHIPPPKSSSYSFSYPGNDYRRAKYAKDLRISVTETFCRSIEARSFELHRKWPKAESLKMCMQRSIPFYTKKIVPEAVNKGKRVLVTSHENALRGILMHLCEIPPEHMNDLHLPNGLPLVYNVRRKCISLLDDGTGRDPMEVHDFGSAAQYLFRPCEITEEDFVRMERSASAAVDSMDALLSKGRAEASTN